MDISTKVKKTNEGIARLTKQVCLSNWLAIL